MAIIESIFGTVTGVLEIAFVVMLIKEIFGIGYPKTGMTALGESARGTIEDAKGGFGSLFGTPEDRAAKKQKKAEETQRLAQANEELGRYIASLAIHGQDDLTKLEDGVKKIKNAMERPDFHEIAPKVKSMTVHEMKNEAKSLDENISKVIKKAKDAHLLLRNMVGTCNANIKLINDEIIGKKGKKNTLKYQIKIEENKKKSSSVKLTAEQKKIHDANIDLLNKLVIVNQERIASYVAVAKNVSDTGIPEEEKVKIAQKAIEDAVKNCINSVNELDKEFNKYTFAKKKDNITKGGILATMETHLNSLSQIITLMRTEYQSYFQLLREIIDFHAKNITTLKESEKKYTTESEQLNSQLRTNP